MRATNSFFLYSFSCNPTTFNRTPYNLVVDCCIWRECYGGIDVEKVFWVVKRIMTKLCGKLSLICMVAFSMLLFNLQAGGRIRWQPLFEPGCGGAMTAVAVSPHNPQNVLLAGDMLGVGISVDGGQNWQLTFGFDSYEMADFAFHPSRPDEIWVGSMSGPYISQDGGVHWESAERELANVEGAGGLLQSSSSRPDPAGI